VWGSTYQRSPAEPPRGNPQKKRLWMPYWYEHRYLSLSLSLSLSLAAALALSLSLSHTHTLSRSLSLSLSPSLSLTLSFLQAITAIAAAAEVQHSADLEAGTAPVFKVFVCQIGI